jgi:hypothetical protein
MNLTSHRGKRPVLALTGVAVALVAAGCSPQITSQSAEQLDHIGDVAVTTNQCTFVLPDFRARGKVVPGDDECEFRFRGAKGGVPIVNGPASHRGQLLLAYEVPNGAKPPAAFAFTEKADESPVEELVTRGDGPALQSGEYRVSPSYAAELEELYPSGEDTKWAAYASTPVTGYAFTSPRWTSTARFGIAGVDETQPFRGPFAFGTVVGSRKLSSDEEANTPIDCNEIDGSCDDDVQGIEQERNLITRAARKLSADAIKAPTRDLAVAPGSAPAIIAGQSGDLPFELRYAGKALSGVAFSLSGTTSVPGATVTAVPAPYAPADDQTSVANLRVAVPAGTPAGTYDAELVASLPNGQQRSARTKFEVGTAAATVQIVSAPSRICVSRRSFTIRLRSTKRDPLVSAVVTVNGKKVQTVKKGRITAPVTLAGLPKGRFTVKITAKTRSGKTRTGTRKYLTCTPKLKGGTPQL